MNRRTFLESCSAAMACIPLVGPWLSRSEPKDSEADRGGPREDKTERPTDKEIADAVRAWILADREYERCNLSPFSATDDQLHTEMRACKVMREAKARVISLGNQTL